jgi:TonB family protein
VTTDEVGPGNAAGEPDEMMAYYGAMWSRIKAKWAFPGGLLPRNDLVAVVHVRIMRNGATESVSLEKGSVNSLFNESALKAVKKASPFPPFPVGIRDASIEVGIRFHSSQLNTR